MAEHNLREALGIPPGAQGNVVLSFYLSKREASAAMGSK